MENRASGGSGRSRVEVIVTTDTADAPPAYRGEDKLYVMFDAAKPEAGKLYFTEAEWDSFVLDVKVGLHDSPPPPRASAG
jgi:hypothetical protein